MQAESVGDSAYRIRVDVTEAMLDLLGDVEKSPSVARERSDDILYGPRISVGRGVVQFRRHRTRDLLIQREWPFELTINAGNCTPIDSETTQSPVRGISSECSPARCGQNAR
jgi:hypothetical protein